MTRACPWLDEMSGRSTFTAFAGHVCIASGSLLDVAKALAGRDDPAPPLIIDDSSGGAVELDLRNGADDAVAEYLARAQAGVQQPRPAGRGRPRLGVVAREVTLLPRHWDWLATQPGGASAALRRLVDEARRTPDPTEQASRTRDAAYKAMAALAGDLPGFEDASRALFAADRPKLEALAAVWPADVRTFVLRLAAAA